MFTTLYIIWFLLPLCFISLFLWSLAKPILGIRGKEDTRSYFEQAIFCLLAFAAAVAIDSWEAFDEMVTEISSGFIDISIARFLLYPAVLLLFALFHGKFIGKDSKVRHQNLSSR